MRTIVFLIILSLIHVESQVWTYPQKFVSSMFRQPKTETDRVPISVSIDPSSAVTEIVKSTTKHISEDTDSSNSDDKSAEMHTYSDEDEDSSEIPTGSVLTTIASSITNTTVPKHVSNISNANLRTSVTTDFSTLSEATTVEMNDKNEKRENPQKHEIFIGKREKPQIKIQANNISQNLLPLPAGASAALVKPTKYHYYPHNQHIYLLPECAIQQVCSAVYVRLNWTQPLCACPSRYRDPCSASLNADDLHTTELMLDKKSRKALTLIKTCEPIAEMRVCHSPRDWSLLALQNIRNGKSHYLIICRCPETSSLEGPMSHDQPTYASVPGIRVYGMMCVDTKQKRSSRILGKMDKTLIDEALKFANTVSWI